MIENLKNYHVFVAGGLGEIGSQLVQKLTCYDAAITILYSSKKYSKRLINLKDNKNVKIIQTDYCNYNNLYEDLFRNCIPDKTNCLISTVGSGKTNENYPYSKYEIDRLWNINYFSNRNLATAISQILMNYKEFNSEGKAAHVFTSSIASSINVNAPFEYCASKAALENIIKSLSKYISPDQRINSISPGHIYTPKGTWGIKISENESLVRKMIEETIPLKRLGNTDEISYVYLFLISSFSSYITGTNITIDGGISIN